MSVDIQMFSVTNAFKGTLVNVFVDDAVIQVWSKNHLIKTVARTRSGRGRNVRADGLRAVASERRDLELIRRLDLGELVARPPGHLRVSLVIRISRVVGCRSGNRRRT
jgi:hypothetical protein